MAEKYTPGGRAHRMLERLAKGPADLTELARLIQGPNQSWVNARHKAWRMVVQLCADGLVVKNPMPEITPSGRAWLDRHGPSDAVVPRTASVRIFIQPKPREGAPA